MGINFRRTTTAALTASAVLAMTAVAVAPAEAATVTVSGTVKLGSPVVAADDLQVLLCAADCVNSSSDPAASDFTDSLGSYSMSASTGTYAVVVYYLSDQPGYDFADDPAYLKLDGSKYTVTTSFAEATKLTVGSANLTFSPTLEPPVTNAQARFTQSTTGSVGYLPCAGHTTTAKPTPFSPSSAHLSYQWLWADSSVIGSSTTVHTIAGATRASYTPGGSLVAKHLFVRMSATLPGYIAWSGRGYIGQVGNPATCTPRLATIPKSWIKSYGKKHGTAKHGKKVSIAGAKPSAAKYRLKVSYQWLLDGKVVKTGKAYKLPASAKGHTLIAKVTFSRAGYKPKVKSIRFGKVK